MLRDVQTYIAQHRTVSLADLLLHFRVDPQALQPMLQKLSHKGRIWKQSTTTNCGTCHSCKPSTLELYEWLKDPH